MTDDNGFLPISRRTFLAGSAAAAASVSAVRADPLDFPELWVETIYSRSGTLEGVRLSLGKKTAPGRERTAITITPRDFAPALSGAQVPRITLTGLTVPNRRFDTPVSPETELSIRIEGIDGFLNRLGNSSGRVPIHLEFRVFAEAVSETDRIWRMRVATNFWQHPKIKGPLEFPEAGAAAARAPALVDVITGDSGAELLIGPGWVGATLSAVTGEAFAARNNFVASLSVRRRPSGDGDAVPRGAFNAWVWQLRPKGTGDISFFDGAFRVREVDFAWRYETRPAAEGRLIAEPYFSFGCGSDGYLHGSANASGKAAFSTILAASPNGSMLEISTPPSRNPASPAEIRFDAVREAGEDGREKRRLSAAIAAEFRAELRHEGDRLAALVLDTADGTSQEQGSSAQEPDPEAADADTGNSWRFALDRPDGADSWQLTAALGSDLGGGAVTFTDLTGPIAAAGTSSESDILASGAVRLRTRGLGPVAVGTKVKRIGFTIAGDALTSFSIVPDFSIGHETTGLPVSVDRDGSSLSALLAVDPFRPVFVLADVPVFGATPHELQRDGRIGLDFRSGETNGPVINCPLDALRLGVRRPRDHLALSFRFANLRLVGTPTGFRLEAVEAEEPTVAPVARTRIPVLVAEFPPQHMAEQAYFRLANSPFAPPELDIVGAVRRAGFKDDDDGKRKADLLKRLNTSFTDMRFGERSKKVAARRDILDILRTLFKESTASKTANEEIIEATITLEESDAEQLRSVDRFAQRFEQPAVELPRSNGAQGSRRRLLTSYAALPPDQKIFVGISELDPDAAAVAWAIADADARLQGRRRLVARLLQVEGLVIPSAAPGWMTYALDGPSPPPVSTEQPSLTPLHDIVEELQERLGVAAGQFHTVGADAAEAAQRALIARKTALATDYRLFRDDWRELAGEAGLGEVEFVSVRWAMSTNERRELFDRVVARLSDPDGSERDPFTARARCRLSGRSRLAFEWRPRVSDGDAADGSGTGAGASGPVQDDGMGFDLESLLKWSGRRMAVPPRARLAEERGPEGSLRRLTDDAEQLALQGITPAQSKSFADRMAKVFNSAARAIEITETAIEFPFRLQLSPAQDARWELASPVDPDFLTNKTVVEPFPGIETDPIWTASLSTAGAGPDLRAVWSEDFRPEAFIARLGRQSTGGDLAPDIAERIEAANGIYVAPPRGAVAPWSYDDEDPDAARPEARRFRASMDAYDRDQIVKLSSVWGLPVIGGIDPETRELRKDANAFLPPDGYEVIDVSPGVFETGDAPAVSEEFSSLIYRPRSLDFRELSLTALGATVDLDTQFEPPSPARTLERPTNERDTALFPAPTLERWRHRAIAGRDAEVELVYKGYLFPFGHRAALVKITERKYISHGSDLEGTDRGPTAYLVQRMLVRVASKRKSRWYDQPSGGRGWPCESLTILTAETADIIDPLGDAGQTDGPRVEEHPSGRLGLGANGRGLVFWPRTAPSQSANIAFEFQIDDTPEKLSLPLIFVDNEAANHPATLAALTDYFNALPSGCDTADFSAATNPDSRRLISQPAVRRKYAVERVEGDCHYETMAWSIGVEGRTGVGLQTEVVGTDYGTLRKERGKALGQERSGHEFGPLLVADDQPPFYPFVQFAVLRLDRIGRLLGERRGKEALVAFDRSYLRHGLRPPTTDPAGGIEAVLNVVTDIRLDAGSKGDRVGAIGRPSGRLTLLARKEGPVTRKVGADDEARFPRDEFFPPAFGITLGGVPAPGGNDEARMVVPGLGTLTNIRFLQSSGSLADLIELILGDSDFTILGAFKLTELIDMALSTLEDNLPVFKETLDYVAGGALSVVELVREEIVPQLRLSIEAIDRAFRETNLALPLDKQLELARVYPRVGSSIAGLESAMDALETEEDPARVATLVAQLPASGKALLVALDEVASDPISPLKLELKRVFLEELAAVDEIIRKARQLADIGETLVSSVDDFTAALIKALRDEVQRQIDDALGDAEAEMIDALRALAIPPETLGPGGNVTLEGAAEHIEPALREVIALTLRSAVEHILAAPVASFAKVFERAQTWDWRQAVTRAVATSGRTRELLEALEEGFDDLDAELHAYWVQIELILREIREAEASIREKIDKLDRTLVVQILEANGIDPKDAVAAEAALRRHVLRNDVTLAASADAARREAERLVRAVLPVSPAKLAETAKRLKTSADRLLGARSLETALSAAFALFSEMDALFLSGRYGAEVRAAFGDTVAKVFEPILDIYEAALEYSDGVVGSARSAVTATAAVEARDAFNAVQGGLDDAVAALGTSTAAGDLIEAVDDFSERYRSEIATAGEGLDFAPFQRLMRSLAEAHQETFAPAFAAAASQAEGLQDHADSLEGAIRSLTTPYAALARATLQADLALADYRRKLETPRDLIDRLRAEPPTTVPEAALAMDALAAAFPRAEALRMLEVWPEILAEVERATEQTAAALAIDGGSGPLRIDLEMLSGLSETQRAAVLAEAVRVEAAIATFAADILELLKERLDALREDVEVALRRSLDGPAQSTRARALSLLRDLRMGAEEAASGFPFLAPVLSEVAKAAGTLEAIEVPPGLSDRVTLLRTRISDLETAPDASELGKRLDALRDAFGASLADALSADAARIGEALTGEVDASGARIQEVVAAEAMRELAALRSAGEAIGNGAFEFLLETVLPPSSVAPLARLIGAVEDERRNMLRELETLRNGERTPTELSTRIGQTLRFLGLAPPDADPARPSTIFLAVDPRRISNETVVEEKVALISDWKVDSDGPKDLLFDEARWFKELADDDTSVRLSALRELAAHFGVGARDVAIVQITAAVAGTLEQILRADISRLVDFSAVREQIEAEIRRLIPTKLTTEMTYRTPIREFKGIFVPTGNGTLVATSRNVVDLGGIDSGSVTVDATANAELSPFAIKLLGGFDAITLYFSSARMSWTLGGAANFDIDFVDYKIGKELEFVEELAQSLTASAGGAFVRPAFGLMGIEAGYKLVIAAINLGGVTFLNVGLSASALLPFDKRKAEFGAALSSRSEPFVIIAGIWGGGGHFGLKSDGRRITSFDASFNITGGGAVAYGPLTLQGRVSVGVFIRKVGSLTEISGDFFVGGAGRIGIFGVSASLTVQTGQDGAGNMTGSAVFRFSFSVGFVKVRFAVTLFKQEGKGFSSAGEEQVALRALRNPYRVATTGEVHAPSTEDLRAAYGRIAQITVNTRRQDQNFSIWQSYFSNARPQGYHDGY